MALFAAVTAWGGSFVAARLLLSPGPHGSAALTPILLATVRFGLATMILLPLLWRARGNARPVRRSDLPTFFLLGQLGVSTYFWLQYTGVQLTNAGLAALLVVGLTPLATTVISGLALREPLGGRRALALALGAMGVAVVVSQKDLALAVESGFLLGAACLIANAVCFAIYSTLVRGLRRRHAPLTITGATTASGALGLLLVSAGDDWLALAALSPTQWFALAYLVLVCSVLAYLLYNFALSRIEASRVTVWLYLEPPVAMLLGAILLGESVAAHTVVGGLIILASIYLTGRL